MKRILLPTALAVALAGTFAFAQQQSAPDAQAPAGHHHRGEQRMHDPHQAALKISQKLNLSADQTAKLEPILADRQQKIAALRSNTALSEQDRRAQFRAIHEDSRKQFAAILTPDQLQQLKSMHRGHHRGGDHAEAPAA